MSGTLVLVGEAAARTTCDEPDDDRALAERSGAGDAQALGALYDRHGTACYRVALAVSANAALAEEIVQEVFLALWQQGAYDSRLGTVRGFLCGLTHHKAVDAVRRESALSRRQDTYGRREQPRGDVTFEPEAAMLSSLRDGAVREALQLLAPAQREAIMLAYFAGHTQREIAELTGVPLGTIKTRTFNGLRRMQAVLEAKGEEIGGEAR